MKLYAMIFAMVVGLTACSDTSKPADTAKKESADDAPKPTEAITAEDRALLEKAQELFKPLPTAKERQNLLLIKDEHIALGHRLYFDERLSKNSNQSCNSCHDVAKGGVDNLPTSPGSVEGKHGDRNSPTVLNAGLQSSQFWDGRAENLAEQAKGPLVNPVEMALTDHAHVEQIVSSDPTYVQAFAQAFDDKKVSIDNIATAIASYEEMLLTPSAWDEYLKGKITALNSQQRSGLKKFIDHGCTACHVGVNLGGDTFQKFGLVKGPYWEFTGSKLHDTGRFEVTGKEQDKYSFRVSGLRNVADTAPYFHDGSVETLDKAVEIMAKTQLGIELSSEDISDIVAFLGATSGQVESIYQTAPQ